LTSYLITMNIDQLALPKYIDTAIIGSGPHALTLATHLIQKSKKFRDKFLVFDPSGTWLNGWAKQFSALQIPHLRSPVVHQPDPNPHALSTFAENRRAELFNPYDLPGTQIFQDFCAELVQRWQLAAKVYAASVVHLEILERGYQLWLGNGKSITARRVVLAHRGGTPYWPNWAIAAQSDLVDSSQHQLSQRLQHSSQIDLCQVQAPGERILIIGGGLTSGHLAIGAMAAGAQVTMMHRREFYAKLFDADPGWLGPKYLKGFEANKDWTERAEIVKNARNGGSLTPAIMNQLRSAEKTGKLSFSENCEVRQAIWQNHHWLVICHDGKQLEFDRLWLATGTQLHASMEPLLSELQATYPTEIIGGLPTLEDHLRWPRSQVFIMGGLAALRVGPTARNLSGARMASQRIVPALTKASVTSLRNS
jgi:cation diffusion facilitator CzcD-associated flavoprotein CzcO